MFSKLEITPELFQVARLQFSSLPITVIYVISTLQNIDDNKKKNPEEGVK